MFRRSLLYASLLAFGLLLAAPGDPRADTTAATQTNEAGGPIYWGVAMQGVPGDMDKLAAWERDVAGKAVSIVHWGHDWDANGSYRPWSDRPANEVRWHGAVPMISWNPEGGDQGRWQLRKIIAGEHDGYIREFAAGAKAWGHPLLLRMMHEMNGAWGYPWQEDSNGNQRGEFVQAWRHIVDIFRQVGADGVAFVWCVNKEYPNSPNPSYASLYPGDDYVDWSCLDGYNWGSNRPEGWESFDQAFFYSYSELVKVAPAKPMLLGEFGTAEQGAPEGASKPNWIKNALTRMQWKYPQVRGIVYFNWQSDGVDWRLESSSAAAEAWRQYISNPYYAANQFGEIEGKPPVH